MKAWIATSTIVVILTGIAQFQCLAESTSKTESAINTSVTLTDGAEDVCASLRHYKFPIDSGLYASIAGFMSVPRVTIPNQKSYTLEIKSFRKKLAVQAVLQSGNAPLVVVLPGIGGQASDDFTKLWPSWFAQSGYHVLWFDSTFLPTFIDAYGHGVSGNVLDESQGVADVIAAFLNLNEVKGRVSQIGVVGISYGAVEALVLGKMARLGSLPFHVDAIQAYSPPLNMKKSAEILDRWYSEDRPKYSMVELQLAFGLSKHKESSSNRFSTSMLRAAISASLHEQLPGVIVQNDEIFSLNKFPQTETSLKGLPGQLDVDEAAVKNDAASNWGFLDYAYTFAYPFWERKLGIPSLEPLIVATQMNKLLQSQPPHSEAIVSRDDPLNMPDDLAELAGKHLPLIILPRGGHVGYINNEWTKRKLLCLFSGCGATAISENYR